MTPDPTSAAEAATSSIKEHLRSQGRIGVMLDDDEERIASIITSHFPKPKINTDVRLFDLVRYMRSELLEADLITSEEYGQLLSCDMAKGSGSPSPRRLESYDELRQKMTALASEAERLREALKNCRPRIGSWANSCPLCGAATPSGEIEHRDECPFVIADPLLKAALSREEGRGS